MFRQQGIFTKADFWDAPYNINLAMLQTARCLKTELHRGRRNIKGSIAEKMKEIW